MKPYTTLLLVLFVLVVSMTGISQAAAAPRGGQPVAGQGMAGHLQDPIAAAKRLLAEAGYPNGAGFPTVELLYNTSEAHKKIAAAIQFMWKKNLGIKITLRNTE